MTECLTPVRKIMRSDWQKFFLGGEKKRRKRIWTWKNLGDYADYKG